MGDGAARTNLLRFAALWLAALTLGPLPASAHRAAASATGLRSIDFKKAPPDFSYDLGMGPTHLSTLNRPVVLNFWATWCEPCTRELDAFARLRAEYAESVSLLTISSELPGVARDFLAKRHLEIPLVEDPGRKIFDAYSISPIPVTIVIARGGLVSHVSVGELDWAELRDAVIAAEFAPPSPAPTAAPGP